MIAGSRPEAVKNNFGCDEGFGAACARIHETMECGAL
jgi:hypothetical protein